MNEELDLDIKNYDLNEILRLFDIKTHYFTEGDLKRAKAKMLKSHPDKSGLNSKFFRFYTEAYNMVYLIWEFNQKGNTTNTEYMSTYHDEEKNHILDNWFNENKSLHENKNSFNEWFNKQFDNTYIYNERDTKGYDNWLRNTDTESDKEVETITDLNKMNQYIEKRKAVLREQSLVERKEVQDIWSIGSNISASDLSPDAPGNYDSGLFSGLSYQDLQKAHTETIIPITIEDYNNTQKFNTINEMIDYRNAQDIQPLNDEMSKSYLYKKNKEDEESSVRIAYTLAKQSEMRKQKELDFWRNVQLLR
jgi:hypothetical protein